jgi:hypothetical protein
MPTFFKDDIIKQYSDLIQGKFSEYSFEILQGRISRTLKNKISNTCHSINESIVIGKEYLIGTLNKSLLNIGDEFEITEGYEIIIMKKADRFCGFMVVSKGLCSHHPDAYIKTLTCSSCPGGGSLFMGLYLFTILKNPAIKDKVGLLEVAGAYYNPVAVCLNEKFGFRSDPSLFGESCFNDPNNLPMKHPLSIKPDEVIKIVLGEVNPVPSPFCLLSKQKSDKIKLLIELKNILLYLDYPYETEQIRDSLIRQKYDIYDIIVDNLEEQGSNDVKKFLEDYADFLESGNSDQEMKEFYESILQEPKPLSNYSSRSSRSSREKKKRRKSQKRRGSSKK